MANRWTGNFDAVIEIAPDGIDQLLAALHRKGHARPDEPASGPQLLHGLSLNLPLDGPIAGRNLRGHLEVQVSTPSTSVPFSGEPNRVTVSTEIYSWFQAAFGSDPAPEFLHGTLALTLGVRTFKCRGELLAEIGSGEVQVSFVPAPGSGASAADVALVEAAVPSILREGLARSQVRIGAFEAGGFAVRDLAFKTLRHGFKSALALLLRLRPPAGPSPSPAGVTDIFLRFSEQAGFAIGREFLTSVLFEKAQAPLAAIHVAGSRFDISFEADVDAASLRLELQDDRLRASVEGSGSVSILGAFRYRVTQVFGIGISNGRLALRLGANTSLQFISGGVPSAVLGLFKAQLITRIRTAAAGALDAVNAALNDVLDDSVQSVLAQLEVPGARLDFVRATIDPDGVILGATVDIGPPPSPVVSFRRVDRPSPVHPKLPPGLAVELEFNAHESWIPGGTIESYRWREIGGDRPVARELFDAHRFIARIPPERVIDASFGAPHGGLPGLAGSSLESSVIGWPPTTWCLEVRGTRVVSGASAPVPVVHSACATSVIVASLNVFRGERLTVRVPDGRGRALADIDPWGGYRPHALADDTDNRGYVLVHHPGPDLEESVAALRKALPAEGRGPFVFATLLVPESARGCPPFVRESAHLACTHDPEKRWRGRFGLQQPGTVVVGPGGREIWRARGPLRTEELAKVLQGLPSAGLRPPRRAQLKLAIDFGRLAPDILFPCGSDEIIALRKMRGRDALICFWTTWSDASLEEIRRLSASSRESDKAAPLLLCVNDGEDPALAARVLREIGPRLRLVADPERVISRRYGVACWPTVVRLDAAGRVSQVRFGLEPPADCSSETQQYVGSSRR